MGRTLVVGLAAGLALLACDGWFIPSSPALQSELLADGGGYRIWWQGDSGQSYRVAIAYLDGFNEYTTSRTFSFNLRRYARHVELTASGASTSRWYPGYSRQLHAGLRLYPYRAAATNRPFGVAFLEDGEPVLVEHGTGADRLLVAFWVDSTRQELVCGADSVQPGCRTARVFIVPESEEFPGRRAIAPRADSLFRRTRARLADSSDYWLWFDRGPAGYDRRDQFALVRVALAEQGDGAVKVRTAYQTRSGLRWVLLE